MRYVGNVRNVVLCNVTTEKRWGGKTLGEFTIVQNHVQWAHGADSQSQLACCCSGAFLRSRKGSELGKSMGDHF